MSRMPTRFSIGDTDSTSTPASAVVNIYSSDRAVYLDKTQFDCSSSSSSCDWDKIFSAPPPASMQSTSTGPQITEYTTPELAGMTSWCRAFTYLRFPTYVLDTSYYTNPLLYVLLYDDTQPHAYNEPIIVHPAWVLAAWAIPADGTGVASARRDGTQMFLDALNDLGEPGGIEDDYFEFFQATITARSLYLINYFTTPAASSPSSDPAHPIFKVSAQLRVWSYGYGSRTSKLGAVVAIAGCICVILRVMCAARVRTVDRSVVDLLMTALEQRPPGVFGAMSEKQAGKLRFHMDNEEDAEFEFS